MKNLEKGARTSSRSLPQVSRVFVRFLQRKFLHRRNVTKVQRHLHSEKQCDQGAKASSLRKAARPPKIVCMQAATDLIEPIERATLAAVSPQALHELPGWLLPLDTGTVGRAKSAVPLRHTADNAQADLVHRMEQHYRARGMQASFRLPDVPSFDAMRLALRDKGYRPEQPTLVQIAKVAAMRAVTAQLAAQVDSAPDAGWASVFLGEGFDPVDGASRVETLSKASGTVFVSVREAGHTIAAAAGAFSHGWASVHGMRTAQAHRGRGLAARVLAGIADTALRKGLDDVFLQVQEDNTSALVLYRRAGFQTAWKYVYWRVPPTKGCAADGC